jgi:hypothetical protein
VEFRVQDGYWGIPWWVMYGLGKWELGTVKHREAVCGQERK